jgi:phosphoglucosamine mutase
MKELIYKKDKLFGTDGIRAKFGEFPLIPESISKVGKAIAIALREFKLEQNSVGIGQDPRYSSSTVKEYLSKGLLEEGISIINFGVVSTPCLAYLTKRLKLSLGIMISASHNPFDDNGIKIFTSNGKKLLEKEESIIEDIFFSLINDKISHSAITLDNEDKEYEYDANSYWINIYLDFLKELYQKKYSGKDFKIVIDCANGSVFKIAPLLFKRLGINFYPINHKPDGYNINQESGAIYPEALSMAVKEIDADVGFAYDGDGDRLILSDEKGNILDGDHILAMCGIDMNEKSILNNKTVIATEMSNMGLEEALNSEGISLVRTKVGDKYVLNEMHERNCNLGGESSGHIIFLDDSPTGDGLITSLKILKIMSEKNMPLSRLSSCIKKYPQIMINVKVKEKIPFENIPKFSKLLEEKRKFLRNRGRIYIRYSGTQDLARIMVEAKKGIKIQKIAEEFAELIKKNFK